MEQSELILTVKQAQTGDETAYQRLYLDTYKSVFYLALRMVKNTEDAEDITQEVFITVNEKISELREHGAFYKWVNQITANKCAAFLRKYRGIIALDDEEEILKIVEDDPLNLPDKAIDNEATRKIILDVIDALPDGQRACIMYYYYQQYTITQIADLLELNENTVKSRLALARGKIRAALEEKEKKEGIKLYGIPLALTPILRQAMELFETPDGVAERMWENISQAMSNPPAGDISASQQGGTSGQNVQNSDISGSSANVAAEVAKAGIPVATKIIIGIIAAAVITAGVFILPRLINAPPDDTPSPAVTNTITQAPDDTGQIDDTVPENSNEPSNEASYYEGDMTDGMRHGYGVWTYENYRYEGWWENDMPSGQGTLYETLEIDSTLPDMYDQTLETSLAGNYIDGAIHGSVIEMWYMTSGKEHRFSFELDKDGVESEFEIKCDCGDCVQIIPEGQIRRVPLWFEWYSE